ncbi:MAG: sulfotransferase [Fidelibacterota bacterium]
MQIISKKPIFILGSERSGTTLLRLILNAHSNIAIPPQTKFTRKILKRLWVFGDLKKENNRKKLTEWLLSKEKNTKLVDLMLSHNELNDVMLEKKTIGGFLSSIYQLYATNNGKKRWGDKRPYYIRFIPLLFQLYPDAVMIHLIRDGRDCVASLKKMQWWHRHPIYSMLNWRYAIRRGKQFAKKYPNQFLEIRYEDLIHRSEEIIKTVSKFIGVEFEEGMLEFYSHTPQNVPKYKMEWHYKTAQPISAQYIGQWRNNLTTSEIQLMDWCSRDELILWNYLNSTSNQISLRLRLLFLTHWFIFHLEIIFYKSIFMFNRVFYRRSLSYLD